jgi:hypothetical protein
MVESIWWADGPFEASPPHVDQEVGQGWLVVASPEALAAIKTLFPDLSRVLTVERSYSQDSRLMSGTFEKSEKV